MKKRILSLLLVVALMASLSVSTLAATYSDISNHWAKEHITKLSDMGYINGFTDGTFKPDANTTAVQALAMLARFYTVSEEIQEWIDEDYGDFVERYIDPTLSWAYDEIAVCLAAGIISETELKGMKLTGSIEKETLSVLLVRAMQMNDEAQKLASTELTFADVKALNANFIGQIALLVEAKVISGDSNNKFNPHDSVNRAMLSKMIVCGLDYLKEQNKTLALTNYQNYSNVSGILQSVTQTTVTLRDYAGVTRKFTVPSSASVTENGKASVLTTQTGCFATVRVENGAVVSVSLENVEGTTWVQGILTSYSASGSGSVIYATEPKTGSSTRYTGADNMKVYRKGSDSNANSIVKNDFATMKIQKGAVVELYLDESSYTVTGKIETLTLGATVTFNVTDAANSVRCYQLNITKLPTIQRGTNPITIERLKVGDDVTVTVKNGEITTITSNTNNTATLDGTLTTVTTTTNGTTWVITDAEGIIHALTLDPAVAAYQGGKAIEVSTIQVGDMLKVDCDGTTIITVTLKSSQTNTSTKLTGKVLGFDAASRTVTVLTDTSKLVYVTTNYVNSILSATTGRGISLSSITTDNQIVAYGTYTNATTFSATSLIVEG